MQYQDFNYMNTGYNTNGNGAGVYTPANQFYFDRNMLNSLGFNAEDMNALEYIANSCGKISLNIIQQFGIPYEKAQEMKYMYDIATGKIVIDSEMDLIKHLRKMFGKNRRISLSDLMLSKINDVPRVAVVSGIKVEPYTIYNSERYSPRERFYKVVNVGTRNIEVETNRRPQLKYGTPKKIEDVLEIKEVKKDKLIMSFNKSVCRLCNRFIIVGSLRRPEFHHGMIEIICIEGTKVYIYAQTLRPNVGIKYNYGTQRVYDYGFMKNEIEPKLIKVASEIYNAVCGVMSKAQGATSDYLVVPPEQPKETDEDESENVFDD